MGDKGEQRGGGQKSQKMGDMMTSIRDGPLASVIILRIYYWKLAFVHVFYII